jgi:hypothetical protein
MEDTVSMFGHSNGSVATITEREVQIDGKQYFELKLIKDGERAPLRRFLSRSAAYYAQTMAKWISDLKATGYDERSWIISTHHDHNSRG